MSSGKWKKLVDGSGRRLIGPARTVAENGFPAGKKCYGRRACVALTVIVGNDLNLMAQKWSEGRNVINDDVDACVAPAGIGPRADFVKKTIPDGDVPGRARFKETGEREQDACSKERKEQDDRG